MPLPNPPDPKDFHSQEEYEEARGYWQENVGRIKGLVEQTRRSKDSSEQDLETPSKVTAQGNSDELTQSQQGLAKIDGLIETVNILIRYLSEADEDKSYEANSILMLQGLTIFGAESVFMQQCFPVMDRLERLIKRSDLVVTREQAVLFKTQLQEIQQLIKASGT